MSLSRDAAAAAGPGSRRAAAAALGSLSFETLLICKVPRLRLLDGRVWTVPVTWAEGRSRFTLLFQQMALRRRMDRPAAEMGHRSNISRAVSAFRAPSNQGNRALSKSLHTCTALYLGFSR